MEGPAHRGAARAGARALTSNPFLRYDPNLCIRCQRCVGACNAAARNHALRTGKRGTRTTVEAPVRAGLARDRTASRAATARRRAPPARSRRSAAAPTARGRSERVRTTCPHCGVGCQLDLVVKDGRIVDAEGAPGPSNKGLLCVKGRSGSFDFVDAPDRLTAPLVRNAATGELEPASWDDALDLVARRFAELRDAHGGGGAGGLRLLALHQRGHLPVPEDGAHQRSTRTTWTAARVFDTLPPSPVWRPCLARAR